MIIVMRFTVMRVIVIIHAEIESVKLGNPFFTCSVSSYPPIMKHCFCSNIMSSGEVLHVFIMGMIFVMCYVVLARHCSLLALCFCE